MEAMKCYLDNSATTSVLPQVCEKMVDLMQNNYGNASSMHKMGFEAEKQIRYAQGVFANIWKCSEQEIFFTSGGTESDNLAILGAVQANSRRGKHIITTQVEHAAVLEAFKALEKNGYEVTYLGVDKYGIISLEELKEAMRPDTIFVSMMHVNNEVGAVMPIKDAGTLIKSVNKDCVFHVDDIQGFSKLKLNPKLMKIDMISVSGHKIHGPKGTGVLYINKGTKVLPQILGGGQQKGMRSGTENVPGIVGMAMAAECLHKQIIDNSKRLYELRQYFVKGLDEIQDVIVNGAGNPQFYLDNPECELSCENMDVKFAPHIISLSIKDVRAEVVLHSLEDKEIYVSSGSACASNKPAISSTLQAMNIDKQLLDSTVRFSFSVHTTKEEIDYTLSMLKELLPALRKFTRR